MIFATSRTGDAPSLITWRWWREFLLWLLLTSKQCTKRTENVVQRVERSWYRFVLTPTHFECSTVVHYNTILWYNIICDQNHNSDIQFSQHNGSAQLNILQLRYCQRGKSTNGIISLLRLQNLRTCSLFSATPMLLFIKQF